MWFNDLDEAIAYAEKMKDTPTDSRETDTYYWKER